MRKVIILAFIIVIGLVIFKQVDDKKTKKEKANLEEDYRIIEQVNSAMSSVVNSRAISSMEQAQWTIFDLRIMYQRDDGVYGALKNKLGENFNCVLSSGDQIFVGVLPLYNKYKIYAGEVSDENMIYPDWNYKAVPKK